MANKKVSKVSIYVRRKGENFRAAPAAPDSTSIYYLRFYAGSRQCWQKIGKHEFVARAKLLLERRLSAAAQGFVLPEPQLSGAERMTLGEAIKSWLQEVKTQRRPNTWSGYRHTLNQFLAASNIDYLDEIKREHLLEFVTCLRSHGQRYSDRSIYNKIMAVAVFLKASGLPKLLRKGDWPKYEEKKPVGYTSNEIAAMKAVANSEELDLLITALDTGFRKAAISNLRWVDIDFANRRITTRASGDWHTKNNKQLVIGLTTRLLTRLQARYTQRRSELYVFPDRGGNPKDHLDRIIQTLAGRAGVSLKGKAVMHSLRKTWATNLSWSGTDIVTIQAMLGHESLQTTQRYVCATDPDDPRLRAQQEAAAGD